MLLGLAFLLGAASFAYLGLQPPALGFPFPNLQGEWVVRPTFVRVMGFYLGRWAGALMLGLVFALAGIVFHSTLLLRLVCGFSSVLALFMFLYLAVRNSPDLILARWTDPSRHNFPTVVLGWLSSFTLVSPLLMGCLFALLSPSVGWGLLFFTNFFFGNAILGLPFILNMQWAKSIYYQGVLRLVIFSCSLGVLFLSVMFFIKS